MTEIVNRPLTVALIWLSLAAGATYLFIFEPGRTGLFLTCPFRALTGFTCPGCGSTRGLHHLLHGDPVAAFQLNPLFVMGLPFMLYALIRYSNAVISRRPLKANQLQPKYIWVLFVAVLSFWIFRNTPWYPFDS
jgi:hypothetical protein